MSSAAKDEFDQLVSSKESITHHPEDSSDEEDSDTLVDERTGKAISSRSSKLEEDANSSDADSDSYPAASRKPTTYTLPKKYTYNANTGPKGVIADAQAFEQEKGVGNKRTYLRTEDFVLPKNQRSARQKEDTKNSQAATDSSSEESSIDETEEDEDAALKKWRERRLSELQNGVLRRNGAKSKQRYGVMRIVDAMAFLEAVENVPKGTVVVVFVYDDELHISNIYQTHIVSLADKYADIKFVALHYEDAEIEHAGVPAVLAYQDGEQFARLLPLKDEVSMEDDVTTNLEEGFRRHQIL